MNLKFERRRGASRRNTVVIVLLLFAVGVLYAQNVLLFSPFVNLQEGAFAPLEGAPLFGADVNEKEEKTVADALPAAGAEISRSTPFTTEAGESTTATETFREAGPLQESIVYYMAIAILGVMLLLNIFKVSFQSSAVFDSDIFKTLSSDTRVEMLYALQERRKTLSELAMQAGISLPGAKQHLALLETKGLVRKMDEGRKWKYYELTDQGRSIVAERFA